MTRYTCTNHSCPQRAPVTASEPPTCYTCAQPMAEAADPVEAEFFERQLWAASAAAWAESNSIIPGADWYHAFDSRQPKLHTGRVALVDTPPDPDCRIGDLVSVEVSIDQCSRHACTEHKICRRVTSECGCDECRTALTQSDHRTTTAEIVDAPHGPCRITFGDLELDVFDVKTAVIAEIVTAPIVRHRCLVEVTVDNLRAVESARQSRSVARFCAGGQTLEEHACIEELNIKSGAAGRQIMAITFRRIFRLRAN
jgi:hypothetical protein